MSLPSLDLVAREVRTERDTQLRHFEGLDTKAGIVLGFAGIIVALSDGPLGPLTVAGQIAAAGAALLALWAFVPRLYPVLDPRRLRDIYVRAEAVFTKVHLLDARIEMLREGSALLERKAVRLRVAIGLLVVAVILFAADALLG